MLFAVAGCRLWTLPVLDRPRRSARVSGPDPHTLRSSVGFQSVGIAPPTRVWRRILVRCLLCQVTSLPASARCDFAVNFETVFRWFKIFRCRWRLGPLQRRLAQRFGVSRDALVPHGQAHLTSENARRAGDQAAAARGRYAAYPARGAGVTEALRAIRGPLFGLF